MPGLSPLWRKKGLEALSAITVAEDLGEKVALEVMNAIKLALIPSGSRNFF